MTAINPRTVGEVLGILNQPMPVTDRAIVRQRQQRGAELRSVHPSLRSSASISVRNRADTRLTHPISSSTCFSSARRREISLVSSSITGPLPQSFSWAPHSVQYSLMSPPSLVTLPRVRASLPRVVPSIRRSLVLGEANRLRARRGYAAPRPRSGSECRTVGRGTTHGHRHSRWADRNATTTRTTRSIRSHHDTSRLPHRPEQRREF